MMTTAVMMAMLIDKEIDALANESHIAPDSNHSQPFLNPHSLGAWQTLL